MPGPKKIVRECSAAEIAEAFSLHYVGVAKKLRTYRALTLDPFQPTAVDYGLVIYGALPNTSPYWSCGEVVAIEHGACHSPGAVRGSFETMRRDKQYPLIDRPTYLSEGTEFLDESADYQRRLDKVLAVAGSLERAFAGMVTLLGWSGRILTHRELGEYQVSDEIFYPERFTETDFYRRWLDSGDVAGKSLEREMLERLQQGDVALIFGWDKVKGLVWREGLEARALKVLRTIPDCTLLPIAAAEAWLKFPPT